MTPSDLPEPKLVAVSVIVPVYKRGSSVVELHRRISNACTGFDLDLILVDDASSDGTWAEIEALHRREPGVSALRLAHNSGQHQALLAGLRLAEHDISVTIDDDFDQRPEDIPLLVARLIESGADLVYGEREIEGAPYAPRSVVSRAFRRLVGRATGVPNFRRIGPFRAFRTSLRDNFSGYGGGGASLDALLGWGAERTEFVPVLSSRKPISKSRYSLSALFGLGIDAAVLYSRRPATGLIVLGMITASVAALLLAYVLLRAVVIGPSGTGFAFVAALVSFFFAFQFVFLGFMMHYISRIFEFSIGRRGYIASEMLRRG